MPLKYFLVRFYEAKCPVFMFYAEKFHMTSQVFMTFMCQCTRH